jgi:hypothetical protein
MDVRGPPCEARDGMWLRVLPLLAFVWLAAGIARAQAPPASFFVGKSDGELRALASDAKNDVLLRRSAATRLVTTLVDSGALDAADAAAREFAANIDPGAIKHAQAVRRRGHVHAAAVAALAVALAMALLSLVAARRLLPGALAAVTRIARPATFFMLYAGLAGGYLASSYENGTPVPFFLFAAFMLPLVGLFRMWSAVGSPRLAARIGRGLAAVTATLAVAFLVVEHVNPAFLGGFGL